MKITFKRILFLTSYICLAASLTLTKLAANYQGINRSLVTRSYYVNKVLFSNFNLNLFQNLLILTFIFFVYKLFQTKKLFTYIILIVWNIVLLCILFRYHELTILGLPYLTITIFLVFSLHFIYAFSRFKD